VFREGLEGEVGQRRSTPERQRGPKLQRTLRRRFRLRLVHHAAKALEIELLGRDLDAVARRRRGEHPCSDRLSQLGDEVLQ
jgi:hypothetical protein